MAGQQLTPGNPALTTITLDALGKKFNREWIFRKLSYTIPPGEKLVILGGNGSGKSTLLQVISGFVTPNEGSVTFTSVGKTIETDHMRHSVSLASPYLQLVEDFTLGEMIGHSGTFKPFRDKLSTSEVLKIIELGSSEHKPVKQFSSGMKQRLKLGLAILADTPLLLLDEPLSNLDRQAIDWYKRMVDQYSQNRTVIVCSNATADEYFFCSEALNVTDFKPGK